MKTTAGIFLVLLMMSLSSVATAKDSKERHEIHLLQLRLQQAAQEKSGLMDQISDLSKKIAVLQANLDKDVQLRTGLEHQIESQKKGMADLNEKNQEQQSKLKEALVTNIQTGDNLKTVQSKNDIDKQQLNAKITKQTELTQACEKKNMDLYKIAVAFMDKYKNKGVMSSLMQEEPFTQIEEVNIENVLQEYRDKADADKFSSTNAKKQ